MKVMIKLFVLLHKTTFRKMMKFLELTPVDIFLLDLIYTDIYLILIIDAQFVEEIYGEKMM